LGVLPQASGEDQVFLPGLKSLTSSGVPRFLRFICFSIQLDVTVLVAAVIGGGIRGKTEDEQDL